MPAAALAGLLLGGCASQNITASLPTVSTLPGEPNRVMGATGDIYAAIASGANSCWFAVNGQIKKSHIFHADANPPTGGGAVEIAVLERDLTGPKPWGAKAFKVALAQSGDQTVLEVENLKMPEAIATTMRADVFHWAQGGRECKLKPHEPPAPPAATQKPKVKGKAKPAAR